MVAAVLLALATYAGIASAWKVHDNAPFGNGGNPPGYAVAASVESSPSATGPSTTPSTAANSSSALNFGPINFAGYNNYVYRDDITAAQIVVSDTTASKPVRFITAFPNGNTGALVYFVPADNQTLGAELNAATVTSVRQEFNQSGITGQLSLNGDATFGVTLIGGVRTLRDYVESGGTVFHSIFNYTLGPYNDSSVTLVRHWINGTTVQYFSFSAIDNCAITVTPNENVTIPPEIIIKRNDSSQNATVSFTSIFNFTGTTPATTHVPLEGLSADSLFLPTTNSTGGTATTSSNLDLVLNAIRTSAGTITEQLAFLSYESESLAGGWRFLTYFGRDTLLALRLLISVFSPEASEAILAAVIQRTNATSGELCHEETIGDYASFVNGNAGLYASGNEASYAYSMVDTDFLLLPTLADYFQQHPDRASSFLQRNSTLVPGTFIELLEANINHVLNLSAAFTANPSVANLVDLRSYPVGDWRDSNAGLGWGHYAFDVNCALVPAALRAIGQLAADGHIPSTYANASSAAQVWEAKACDMFAVTIAPDVAAASLDNYVTVANLSTSQLYGGGSLNGSTNATALGWSDPSQTIGLGSNSSTFYALSLLANGSAVEVLHSDLGFALLYGVDLSPSLMWAVVQALQPYPRGLLTNVGMVVANAAYDNNRTAIDTFSNLAYHGAVSWSWQQGLMAEGISKQLGLCGLSPSTQLVASNSSANATNPAWCADTTLTSALEQAQARLWASIEGSASELYTEVWSPVFANATGTFTVGDLGALSPEGTEGDAVQLWSYGFLAMIDPRTGKPVAEGFGTSATNATGQ